jgi:hypothetical protein
VDGDGGNSTRNAGLNGDFPATNGGFPSIEVQEGKYIIICVSITSIDEYRCI